MCGWGWARARRTGRALHWAAASGRAGRGAARGLLQDLARRCAAECAVRGGECGAPVWCGVSWWVRRLYWVRAPSAVCP